MVYEHDFLCICLLYVQSEIGLEQPEELLAAKLGAHQSFMDVVLQFLSHCYLSVSFRPEGLADLITSRLMHTS